MLQSQLQRVLDVAQVFFAPVRQVLVGNVTADDDVPLLSGDDFLEFLRTPSRRI